MLGALVMRVPVATIVGTFFRTLWLVRYSLLTIVLMLALGTLTSGKPYDVFGYISGGALALELLAWTNDTTRATAVTLQDVIPAELAPQRP